MTTTRRTFLKHTGTAALMLGVLPHLSKADLNPAMATQGKFKRMSPESQGVSSVAISNFIEAANSSGLEFHSFMFLRHGHVIAEAWWAPFEAKYKHTLYSLSKSFTSTAVGLLVKEGKINIEDAVISFFPDELPGQLSENLKQMKIKNLLTMNTGHGSDTTAKMREGSATWTKTFLSLPVEHTPGSHFLYNTGATYMLGAIVKKISGEDLEAFLTPRLFDPLGIKDHDWERSPQGLNVAGWGLRVKTEDIAKLGQLYLQKGKWDGKQILTEAWVTDAGSYQTSSNTGDGDWSQGYGYQFWRCKPGFFRGDGAFGQYCVVMPEHDVVIVVNSESWDMQKQMTIMWDHLLPGMKSSRMDEDKLKLNKLSTQLAHLSIPVTRGLERNSLSTKLNNKKFSVAKNEMGVSEIQFKFSDRRCTLTVESSKGSYVIETGWQNWVTGNESSSYPLLTGTRNPVPSRIAGTAAWISENTLQLDVKFVEAIHGDKITCIFDNNKVSITLLNSVSANTKNNPDKRERLEGRISDASF